MPTVQCIQPKSPSAAYCAVLGAVAGVRPSRPSIYYASVQPTRGIYTSGRSIECRLELETNLREN